MSCEHAGLKLKAVPGPATVLVCAECGIRAEHVVDALYSRWKQCEAAAGLLNELSQAVLACHTVNDGPMTVLAHRARNLLTPPEVSG